MLASTLDLSPLNPQMNTNQYCIFILMLALYIKYHCQLLHIAVEKLSQRCASDMTFIFYFFGFLDHKAMSQEYVKQNIATANMNFYLDEPSVFTVTHKYQIFIYLQIVCQRETVWGIAVV